MTSWAALIAALIALFSPVVQQWLNDLLTKVEALLTTAVPADPAVAVHDVFAAARGQLGVWSWIRGRTQLLAVFERIALARAAQLAAVIAKGSGTVPNLTPAEIEMVKALEG